MRNPATIWGPGVAACAQLQLVAPRAFQGCKPETLRAYVSSGFKLYCLVCRYCITHKRLTRA